jgi:O-antigen biosynthesis protein
MTDRVSVYIPCYNGERYLEPSLEALLQQTHTPDEIIVVDDASTDHSVKIASRYPVRLIRHKQNKGLAATRNTGILNSRNELVASIDQDVVPAPDWLERLLVGIHRDGFAGGGGRLLEKFQEKLADRWRAAHMRQDRGEFPKDDLPTLSTNNTLFKASAINQVGLYDEALRRSFEDWDMCFRLRSHGFRLYYRPDAVCYHLRRDTIQSVIRTWWQWGAPAWQRKAPTLHNLLAKLKQDLRLCLRYMREDNNRHVRLGLTAMDLLMLSYSVYADLRYFLRDRRRDSVPRKNEQV